MSEVERKTLADLEWEQVEWAVAERCRGPLANGLKLPLAESFAETERALAEAKEAFSLLTRNEPLPLEGICEIGVSLQHLEREGVLDGSALKDIRTTLRAAAELRRFLGQRKESVPYLHRACAIDPTLESLEEELGMSIGDDGSILDSASAELARLREEAGNLRARIIRKLEDLIQKRSAILQDSFYTIREGRYVLPVRADAHERFHGIVHGSSASGATVFVEPRELVERGNRLKMVQAELEREERRILAALADLVRQYVPQMRAAAEALDHADLRGASARLAVDLGAEFIELSEQPRISLRGARHPLLVLRGIDVVANDLDLSGGEALVISGPNAGGKTVALKMLGLAALMIRAGLPVPAEEGSVCGFFSPVLAAVGDEQSLERSLSTFSAHLVTLRGVLELAGERVLVLLDELAGATDPEAGASLACAIIEALVERADRGCRHHALRSVEGACCRARGHAQRCSRLRFRQHGSHLPIDDGCTGRLERTRDREAVRYSGRDHRGCAQRASRTLPELRDAGGQARGGDQDRARGTHFASGNADEAQRGEQ